MNVFDESPSERPLFFQKRFLMIAGAMVVFILLIFFVWNVVSHRNETKQQEGLVKQATAELEKALALCQKSDDPTGCAQTKIGETAIRIGAAIICTKLDGEAKDNCVLGTALEHGQIKDCDLMEDKEGKTSCEDAVYQRLAYEENHLDYCNKMESSLGKDRCLDGVSYQIAVKQGCGEKTGIEPSVCEAIQTLERVIASQDPSQCMNIFQENDRSVCLEAIGSGDRDHDDLTGDQETRFGTSDTNPDTDGDGLTDKDEIMVWGTNPLVSDSDGDHFTDAEEVQGGYNPLGAGRL